ncbi:uncharacterized protein LOC119099169 [Pollicipes pollicipes]|uniref:uncharacterized protein LOC119099169 n=1 Tax=Pollicipes pollicipes TaxID=41117 RepID=UPI0018854C0D|nr:uncharacterized protein LOC119099169 [Pollicipes pollicipes]
MAGVVRSFRRGHRFVVPSAARTMRNVEIKARVRDASRLRQLAAELSGSAGHKLVMRDTFFSSASGRLKLREQTGAPNQLIFYDRPDTAGPKLSDFCYAAVGDDVAALRDTLGRALGVRGDVQKTRLLFMVDQTRVHVDSVAGLGDFMELEVKLREDQTLEQGQAVAEALMKQLEVEPTDLIDCAYVDMLEKQSGQADGQA